MNAKHYDSTDGTTCYHASDLADRVLSALSAQGLPARAGTYPVLLEGREVGVKVEIRPRDRGEDDVEGFFTPSPGGDPILTIAAPQTRGTCLGMGRECLCAPREGKGALALGCVEDGGYPSARCPYLGGVAHWT